MGKSIRQKAAEEHLNLFFAYEDPPDGMSYDEIKAHSLAYVNSYLLEIASAGTFMPDRVCLSDACAWLLFGGEHESSMKHAGLVHDLARADAGISFHAIAEEIGIIRDAYEASLRETRAAAAGQHPAGDMQF